jgi:cytochrome c556
VNRLHQSLVAGLALAVMAALGTPTLVAAQDASPQVEYRKSIMQGFRLHQGAVRAVLDGAAPAGHVVHHAAALQGMAAALANAFPAGPPGPGSRALPAIWENRTDFMNKVSAIQSASAALSQAATAGDTAAINAAFQAFGATCAGCHQTYRGPAG